VPKAGWPEALAAIFIFRFTADTTCSGASCRGAPSKSQIKAGVMAKNWLARTADKAPEQIFVSNVQMKECQQ
jgi:hypothetical protein